MATPFHQIVQHSKSFIAIAGVILLLGDKAGATQRCERLFALPVPAASHGSPAKPAAPKVTTASAPTQTVTSTEVYKPSSFLSLASRERHADWVEPRLQYIETLLSNGEQAFVRETLINRSDALFGRLGDYIKSVTIHDLSNSDVPAYSSVHDNLENLFDDRYELISRGPTGLRDLQLNEREASARIYQLLIHLFASNGRFSRVFAFEDFPHEEFVLRYPVPADLVTAFRQDLLKLSSSPILSEYAQLLIAKTLSNYKNGRSANSPVVEPRGRGELGGQTLLRPSRYDRYQKRPYEMNWLTNARIDVEEKLTIAERATIFDLLVNQANGFEGEMRRSLLAAVTVGPTPIALINRLKAASRFTESAVVHESERDSFATVSPELATMVRDFVLEASKLDDGPSLKGAKFRTTEFLVDGEREKFQRVADYLNASPHRSEYARLIIASQLRDFIESLPRRKGARAVQRTPEQLRDFFELPSMTQVKTALNVLVFDALTKDYTHLSDNMAPVPDWLERRAAYVSHFTTPGLEELMITSLIADRTMLFGEPGAAIRREFHMVSVARSRGVLSRQNADPGAIRSAILDRFAFGASAIAHLKRSSLHPELFRAIESSPANAEAAQLFLARFADAFASNIGPERAIALYKQESFRSRVAAGLRDLRARFTKGDPTVLELRQAEQELQAIEQRVSETVAQTEPTVNSKALVAQASPNSSAILVTVPTDRHESATLRAPNVGNVTTPSTVLFTPIAERTAEDLRRVFIRERESGLLRINTLDDIRLDAAHFLQATALAFEAVRNQVEQLTVARQVITARLVHIRDSRELNVKQEAELLVAENKRVIAMKGDIEQVVRSLLWSLKQIEELHQLALRERDSSPAFGTEAESLAAATSTFNQSLQPLIQEMRESYGAIQIDLRAAQIALVTRRAVRPPRE